jgi:hypothetical protein
MTMKELACALTIGAGLVVASANVAAAEPRDQQDLKRAAATPAWFHLQ